MKIQLIYFTNITNYAASMLGNLAQMCGWDVAFKYFPDDALEDDIANALLRARPDLVAISIKTFERRLGVQVANIAKSLGMRVVAGGPHATDATDDLVALNLFDAVVVGDGMGVLPDILENFLALEGQAITGKRHQNIALYSQRLFDEEQERQIRESRMYTVIGSFGCPFKCTYCATTRQVGYLPVEHIVESIEKAKEKYNIEWVAFLDDTYTYSIKKLRQFHDLVRERGLKFEYQEVKTRVDCLTDEIAEELTRNGVEEVSFGIETTSPRLLAYLKKGCTLEDNYRAAEICRRNGLSMRINLMFGVPTQDADDYEITQRYVEETQPASITSFYFTPFPGTELFQHCLDNGYLPKDWSFDNFLSLDMNQREFKGWRHTRGILRNIDYDMAEQYLSKIQRFEERRIDEIVMRAAESADEEPWVVVGARKYFFIVLERLSQRKWKNLLGCYNLVEDDFQPRKFEHNIPYVHSENGLKNAKNVVVTLHKGHFYEKVILPRLRETMKFKGKVISASTWPSGYQAG